MSSSPPDAALGAAALGADVPPATPAARPRRRGAAGAGAGWAPYWQAAPLAIVLALFLVLPLLVTAAVSLWDYTEFTLVPDVTLRNYREMFEGCLSGGACSTLRKAGFEKVFALDGGIGAWEQAGLPLTKK